MALAFDAFLMYLINEYFMLEMKWYILTVQDLLEVANSRPTFIPEQEKFFTVFNGA